MVTFSIVNKEDAPEVRNKYKWENIYLEALNVESDQCLLIECSDNKERRSIISGFRNQSNNGYFDDKGVLFMRIANPYPGNEFNEKRVIVISFNDGVKNGK